MPPQSLKASPSHRLATGPSAFDILETVFHLLRRAPLRALACYYIGTLPFWLALLYFWADMSKSAVAHAQLAQEAFLLALLFTWMKAWQVGYARQLWSELSGAPPPRWTPRRIARMLVRQAVIHTTGLFLLPVALLITLPFLPAYAAYQNMTVLETGQSGPVNSLTKRAWELAKLWPKQNAILVWSLSPFLMLAAAAFYLVIMPFAAALTPDWTSAILAFQGAIFLMLLVPLSPLGLIIAINIGVCILIVPELLRMLLGVQTAFAQSPGAMMNSTFFAVVCGLAFLCMDPLMKAAYVLRCFYGESLETGEDLKVELRHLARKGMAGILLLAGTVALFAGSTMAQETPVAASEVPASADPSPTSGLTASQSHSLIASQDLSSALDNELQQRVYAWRMPRVKPTEEEEGVVLGFLRAVFEELRDWAKKVLDWLRKIADWFDRHLPQPDWGNGRSLSSIGAPLRVTVYGLLALLVIITAIMAWRIWKRRQTEPAAFMATVAAPRPDLEDEEVAADALPEDRWLGIARELIDQGELRLALRAVFLATLAHLAQRQLINIARFKSNRDYRQELSRRAHAEPAVLEVFSQSVGIFESVWYGMHETTRERLESILANQERLQAREQE